MEDTVNTDYHISVVYESVLKQVSSIQTTLNRFPSQLELRTLMWEPLVEETDVTRLEMMRLIHMSKHYLSTKQN
jgi:uncharacterized FlgJ-related protein